MKQNKKELNDLELTLINTKRAFKYIIFFGFIINLLTIATSVYSLQVFDRVLSTRSVNTLIALTIINLLFLITLGVIQYIRSEISMGISEYIEKKLSKKLFNISISNSIISNNANGSINIRDLNNLKSFISGTFVALLDAPWSILYIISLYFIHPLICLLVIISGIALLMIAYLNEKITKEPFGRANDISIKSNQMIDLASRNAEVVEGMGMGADVVNNWSIVNEESIIMQNKASRISSVLSNITKTLRTVIYTLSTALGAYLVINNRMSSGGMIAGSILSGKALAPFESAIGIWKQVINVRKSYSRMSENLSKSPLRNESITLPEPKGEVIVDKVGYVTADTRFLIIKGVNIKINQGEVVAVIGSSGSGKTTLLKIIAGIYKPTSGVVRLDGADIYRWPRRQINEYVGYLPQDIELFDGTIKENIARMNKGASDEKIIEAAQMANVHSIILNLQNGYETNIGNDGCHLSSGQRQRIALARAFYNNPKLIIMDEPNSNLDMEGDKAFMEALKKAKSRGQTIIVVSHKTQILSIADKTLYMQNGEAKMYDDTQKVVLALNAGFNKSKIEKSKDD